MSESIRLISFDLDGTLVESAFDEAIWFQEIPRRYAAKHGLAFEHAKKAVLAEYRAMEGHPRWTDMGFWFARFELGDWQEGIKPWLHLIRPYPETQAVLERLHRDYRLVILTQAERKFHELKLGQLGLGDFFEAVYDTPGRFGKLAKDASVYHAVLVEQGVAAEEALHVGDHRLYDYHVPRCAGLRACWLDRNAVAAREGVVRDLWGVVAYLRNPAPS